jgi:hypothetical protein
MSDGSIHFSRENQRVVGAVDQFVCIKCGIPKHLTEFNGESLACIPCASRILANSQSQVSAEDLRKTKFDIAREELQETQAPAIPGGIRKAHEILNGKSSSELLAESIVELRTGKDANGKQTFLPQDGKLYVRMLETLQRAEIKHDEFLKSQPPTANISYEEATRLSIDTIVQEMIRDRRLRLEILGILYQRCHDLIGDIMEVANVTVVNPTPAASDLENGGVI